MIQSLDYEAFKGLYSERISADFPKNERRPLWIIRRLYRQGRYSCLVLMENGSIAAYATFIHDKTVRSVLLDYYAVDQAQRGSGVGSRFFAMLPERWPAQSGLLLECESPDSARDAAEKETRTRRIRFYQRGGAEVTDVGMRAFGVDYSILWLPIQGSLKTGDIQADIMALYGISLPLFIKRLFVKTWEIQ